MKMTKQEEIKMKCLDFINLAVDNCLKLSERRDQNKRFAAIRTDLPIRPIKMTLTTAVFHFKNQTDDYVIKRVIVKDESPTQEDTVSLNLVHKNVIVTYDSFTSYFIDHKKTKQKILWIFSEFLKERISQRSVNRKEEIIRDIIKDSLTALKYMHEEKNTVHLDLKIANIMGDKIKNKIVYKLIDFGYSRDFNKDSKVKQGELRIPGKSYGTFPYKPPEVVFENIHGKASDIWCIGAIAWFLSLGETPFYKDKGEKDINEYRRFLKEKSKHFFEEDTTPELRHFIKKCMQRNRLERPTARELLDHPFITGKSLVATGQIYDGESDIAVTESQETDSGYDSGHESGN